MYDAELKCIKIARLTLKNNRLLPSLDKQFHGIVTVNKHQIQFKQLVAVNQRAHRSI